MDISNVLFNKIYIKYILLSKFNIIIFLEFECIYCLVKILVFIIIIHFSLYSNQTE